MHSGTFDINERKQIQDGKIKGCPVCKSKDVGKKYLEGIQGSSDHVYFCQNCSVVRLIL